MCVCYLPKCKSMGALCLCHSIKDATPTADERRSTGSPAPLKRSDEPTAQKPRYRLCPAQRPLPSTMAECLPTSLSLWVQRTLVLKSPPCRFFVSACPRPKPEPPVPIEMMNKSYTIPRVPGKRSASDRSPPSKKPAQEAPGEENEVCDAILHICMHTMYFGGQCLPSPRVLAQAHQWVG